MTGLTGNRVITGNYEYMTCQNDQEIFRDQVFIQKIENFLLTSEKRTNFFNVRNHVVDSVCENRCLLELTARKLRRFVLKIFKILKL